MDLSLRPLASTVGSSPRVLLYLFGSKNGLIRALLARARVDELTLIDRLHSRTDEGGPELVTAAKQVWSWLVADEHRTLLTVWVEGYARSLIDPQGAMGRLRPRHRRGLARSSGHCTTCGGMGHILPDEAGEGRVLAVRDKEP